MSSAGHQSDADARDAVASLREAGLVHLAPVATGDAVAAAGILARGLDAVGVPFQISVVRTPSDATHATEADWTVGLGGVARPVDQPLGGAQPASVEAFEIARSLDEGVTASADVGVLAAAGVRAAGETPTGPIAETLDAADIDRRPGLAVPTDDLADGLAHSTLLHAPFSGDRETARAALAEHDALEPTDEEARRRVASIVALLTVEPAAVDSRAGDAVERALRPYAGGPFETVGGYGDVLDAVAREQPGLAVALALGHGDAEAARSAWRSHAERVHDTVRAADIRRHAGLVVATIDGPTGTVARLMRDFRSPESLALVVGDERATLAATPGNDARAILESAMAQTDDGDRPIGDADRAHVPLSTDGETLIERVREVVADE